MSASRKVLTVLVGILAYEAFYLNGVFLADALLLKEGVVDCLLVVYIMFLSVGGLAVIAGFALAHRGSLFPFVVFSTFCGLLSGALTVLFLLLLIGIAEIFELYVSELLGAIMIMVWIGLLVLLAGFVRPEPDI